MLLAKGDMVIYMPRFLPCLYYYYERPYAAAWAVDTWMRHVEC